MIPSRDPLALPVSAALLTPQHISIPPLLDLAFLCEASSSSSRRSLSKPDPYALPVDVPLIRRYRTPPNPHDNGRMPAFAPADDDVWGVQTETPYQRVPHS